MILSISARPRSIPALTLALTLGACCSFLAPHPALAGSPFVVDDGEVLEKGVLDISLNSTAQGSGLRYAGSNSLEVYYGLDGNTHLHVLIPQSFLKDADGSRIHGPGDVEVGLKIRLYELPESGLKVVTAPAVLLPVGREEQGLGNGEAQLFLPVWMQKNIGSWTSYGGAGVLINRSEGMRNSVFSGVGLQRELGDRFTVGGEIYHSTPTEVGGQSSTFANVGLIFSLNEVQSLMIGAGRNIDGHGRDHRIYISYSVTIGPKGEETNPFNRIRNLFKSGG